MLVAHNAVEAHLIGQGVLLVVLVVEDAGLVGVKIGVGETQAAGVVLLQVGVGYVAVGLLGEPVNFRLVFGSRKLIDHSPLLSRRSWRRIWARTGQGFQWPFETVFRKGRRRIPERRPGRIPPFVGAIIVNALMLGNRKHTSGCGGAQQGLTLERSSTVFRPAQDGWNNHRTSCHKECKYGSIVGGRKPDYRGFDSRGGKDWGQAERGGGGTGAAK